MYTIIGRKQESAELLRHLNSGRAEFIAVYGRRRVGKTFLITELLRDFMVFDHTGLSPYDRTRRVTLKDQLLNFYFSLVRHGFEHSVPPRTWMDAFFMLEQLLERLDTGMRQVVFIDELPWMDSARSGFLTALEAFWNGWGNRRHSLCLVVCGSATSWMLDNLINNKGGLYGRLTAEIQLSPFSLRECEQYLKSRNITLSRYNVAQAYMILGGIPFYLSLMNPSYSLAQNIDALFFGPKAKLGDEFERLFNSIFDHADQCMSIVRTLGRRHSGYTRGEISQLTGIAPNGELTKMLKALVGSEFVMRYKPMSPGHRQEDHYRLTDHFCWFWLHFKERKHVVEQDYWQHHLKESEVSSWRGLAFEEVCFRHIRQIKYALQVAGVSSRESAYLVRGDGEQDGLQIDLLIDRADDVVNVCEMKFNKTAPTVTKAYASRLAQRLESLERAWPDKTFVLTLVSAHEATANEYSEAFAATVTLDDLFA